MTMKYSTMIGSLPHKESEKAVEEVFETLTLPCWPQLPKISFKEQMHVQYTENFPGIKIEQQNEKIWVDNEKFNVEITDFFQNFIDNNLDYFSISKEYACGFYDFIEHFSKTNFKVAKLQTIGPLTFGLTLKNETGRAILYDEQMKDTVIKNIIMKSVWQIKEILRVSPKVEKIFLFLDEPYLAAYGSAFTAISMSDVKNILSETIFEIKNQILTLNNKINLLVGIHCCANTDWGILTDLNLNIISFDAHDFFNDFALYKEKINNFISKENNLIAWGIVPNNINIHKEDVIFLKNKLKDFFSNFNSDFITKKFIITPQCGIGNASEEIVKKILKTCTNIVTEL